MNRRRFLKQSFCFSAACSIGLSLPEGRAASSKGRYFLTIGDYGSGDRNQTAVADAMKRFVEEAGGAPDGLWLLGDNFYSEMKGGVDSVRWRTGFEEMYPASHFPGPCRVVLGNHDYHDNSGGEQVQLQYAKAHTGTRWTLPSKWYRVDYPSAEEPLVTFLCLDSNLPSVSGLADVLGRRLRPSLTSAEDEAQRQWFEAELAKPRRAPFLAVVAHHPLYSNGSHGDTKRLIKAWDRLFREHKVDFYFCGHDHDLQHLEFKGHPTSFVTSGAGGARARGIKEAGRGPFSRGDIYGFSEWRIEPERFVVNHYDVNRRLLHSFAKTPEGEMTVQ